METIKIAVKTKDTLSIDLLTPLQGDLKILQNDNYEKLKNEILQDGFSFSIFVWENISDAKIYIIDGHQRYATLQRMKEEGYAIPQIPVVFVEADNLDHAKRKVLAAASQYGSFNQNGAEQFISSITNMSLHELQEKFVLPNINMEEIHFDFQPINSETTSVSFEASQTDAIKKAKDKTQFLILITCKNESEQQKIFEKLQQEEIECQLI